MTRLKSLRLNRSSPRRCVLPGQAAAVVLVGAGLISQASAQVVILVRHGHKDVTRTDFNLSPQGLQQALELSHLIPAGFWAPTRIIRYAFHLRSGKIASSDQTMVPLAGATGSGRA